MRQQHRALAKQRQHTAMLPGGRGARRLGAAPQTNRGRALAENARVQLQGRRGPGSNPVSRHGTPETGAAATAAACSDDRQHVLAAAAAAGEEDEEVTSASAALAPEAAVADLKR